MNIAITENQTQGNLLYLIQRPTDIQKIETLRPEEQQYGTSLWDQDKKWVLINQYKRLIFICTLPPDASSPKTWEQLRKTGAEINGLLNRYQQKEITFVDHAGSLPAIMALAEGMALANYQFLKYRKDREKAKNSLETLLISGGDSSRAETERLFSVVNASFRARDLVNEPANFLSAIQLAEELKQMTEHTTVDVHVLHKEDIERERMGGILAVNRGSTEPPTFSVLTYKPENARNIQPVVLVGKGIVYDTGGLSLKPTLRSMDRMKTDMSGAAVVSGALMAIAEMKVPLYVIALIPSTDNRPGENAYTPGDIITMYDGTTIEVLNTDAEGRLVLADALHWAKRYRPGLVIDVATLTGAAANAVGEYGIVCMGTADEATKTAFHKSGARQYERLVEYPLWEEYAELLKTEIADLKNIGGPIGGAITAGKFLEHFTDYPWMHFDIAGVSFASSKKGYIPAGGTAVGLRMLVDFLMNYQK